MKILSHEKVPKQKVTAFDSEKTTVQWLRTKEESEQFMLRRFEMLPYGKIGLHKHPEEHQIFIVEGPLFLVDEAGTLTEVNAGDFVYVPPEELHGYVTKEKRGAFVCGIPKLA